ncbi:MAG: ATP synthase F1 subunit epsilon [Candidatus Gottesmanbacteria bacterium]|nr:ATP synthase F1 subunit epsilon [Candidatus Gottesmanbacteria bacterium]
MYFQLDIVTPDRTAYSDAVTALSVPTPNGAIGVLPKHVGLFTVLGDGEIKISTGSKELFLAIGGGFMQVTREKVSILVARAVHADELNEKAIKDAEAAARAIVTSQVKGEELAAAQAILRRSVLEMKVMRRHRTPHISPLGSH